jgi:hypothetical protein
MSLPCRFEKMIRLYRGGRINEAEFTLNFLSHALYDPVSLASASLELTAGELRQLIACGRAHGDKQSFREISGSFIVDRNMIGIWEAKERELRPLFNRIVEWFEEHLKLKQEGSDPHSLQFSPYRLEYLIPGAGERMKAAPAYLAVFSRLKDLSHVESFKGYGEAPMIEAVTYVCSRDYPVILFGYRYSMDFRVTTAMTDHLQEGDWTIEFGWNPGHECFGFSMFEGTSRGVVSMPSRECERADFANAIDELIDKMAGERSQLWR